MDKRAFFISTSIPYVNASPHIGHAQEFVLADVIARHQRLTGRDVFFLSGSDDNALKNVQSAEAAGADVKTFVKEHSQKFKDLLSALKVKTDDFIQTGFDERHIRGAQKLWEECAARGDIEKRRYRGLYCVGCEEFKTAKELVNGECSEHPGKKLEEIEEENYFFRLDRYQGTLKKLITSGELSIIPESRKNETLAFIEGGLEPFSISRSIERARGWGVPVPHDDSQIMYVWFDALSNYINALGYAGEFDLYKKFWTEGETLHVIGKGINRFHTVYWPAMLLSAGVPLPKKVFVHGYITIHGQKMSKSLGNVVDPFDLISRYGTEPVRYFLTRHTHPFEDSDFTEERFRDAYNANLANGLGNLVARVLKLAEDNDVKTLFPEFKIEPHMQDALENFRLHEGMDFVWQKIQTLDRRINEKEPYKLVKSDPAVGKAEIQVLVQGLFEIARLLEAFLPETSQKILDAIKANKKPETLFPRIA